MKFVAYERTKQGTGASRRLRNAAKVPGIVYGAGTPTMIELDHNALFFALKKEAFHSSILEMELAGKTETVLLRDYSMHAYKPIVMHVDFQRVDEKTTLRKRVPLHFVNEEVSEAVKTDKCFINKALSELEIECLAQKLPEFITIDLGGMKKGDSIHARDLKLDEGIKIVRRGQKDITIVSAVAPKAEADEGAAAEAAAGAAPAAAAAPDAKAAKAPAKEKQNKK
ncbi:MAG TPA: 50S ribosomal protein L25/general stress protein Ctc [Burkholderiaceae bacterium]|nr:50S ribosomal protein L25/general stress protein Ctc [Burkholderiaceae bacterium]HRP26981.1 50S ribosomal protein L25/general stress protein Ctc [Burkholderiaceae bacterium]